MKFLRLPVQQIHVRCVVVDREKGSMESRRDDGHGEGRDGGCGGLKGDCERRRGQAAVSASLGHLFDQKESIPPMQNKTRKKMMP
jgi:hypothetical protein